MKAILASLLLIFHLLACTSSAALADLRERTVVKAPNGAIYLIEFGFKKRVPDRETLEALGRV